MVKDSITMKAEVILATGDYEQCVNRLHAGNQILRYLQAGQYTMSDEKFLEFCEDHLVNLADIATLARVIVENQEADIIRDVLISALKKALA
jgi:hypothetical protein